MFLKPRHPALADRKPGAPAWSLGPCRPLGYTALAAAILIALTCSPATIDSAPQFSEQELIGKVYFEQHQQRFRKIDARYASRAGMYMNQTAYKAFQEMYAAALKQGIKLTIVSAGRNFYDQKRIWEGKWSGQRLVGGQKLNLQFPDPGQRALASLRYSSMPGTSRHHWGTDIDLVNLTNSYFASGHGKKIYTWLIQNAAAYGFCQPYTSKQTGRPGYEEEKWHWSYRPLAAPMLQSYLEKIDNTKISGFAGSSVAPALKVVQQYVAGIDPACK
ncbi:MAG: M15 family metallopeptidase [Leptospiraceae bacterium]|nr:M15 family metallopeptidase [Leptospiraceae bacterium]